MNINKNTNNYMNERIKNRKIEENKNSNTNTNNYMNEKIKEEKKTEKYKIEENPVKKRIQNR